jgi:hypothetical protein
MSTSKKQTGTKTLNKPVLNFENKLEHWEGLAVEEDDSGSEDESFCWEQHLENRVEIFILIIFNMPGLYSSDVWHFYHNVVVK